ncbi:MAG: hypothetical protein GY778_09760 [bacterium]|nr:hypothetical protein [bacterium]
MVEQCSPGPRLELFARYPRPGWYQWGNEMNKRLWTDTARHTTLARTYSRKFVVYRTSKYGSGQHTKSE